jgi:hypothetical protein
MRRQAVEQLSSVIRANTERRSLEELAAAGKRHVRVVSGRKVIQLIEAIVDNAIAREAREQVENDRDRLVEETQAEFDRVSIFQAEQEAEIRRHRELAEHYRLRSEKTEERLSLHAASLEEAIDQREACDERIERIQNALVEVRRRYDAGEEERVKARKITENALERCLNAEAKLEQTAARLRKATNTIENYDREFERLAGDLESERLKLAAEREAANARERALGAEAGRLEAEIEGRDQELAALRSQAAPEQLQALQSELTKMTAVVRSLADRPAGTDTEAIEALVSRLSEREIHRASELEERFNLQMERTLDEVTRALKTASAKPLDYTVEATDVLVDRVFDQEHEMRTNLGALAVEERSSRRDIAGNLARLKKAQLARDDEA